jgi:hypothetical protein
VALAGDGILGLWFDIAPGKVDDFYEWHNREHMPERLGNAGFRSGRRFVAIDAPKQYFVLYETKSPDTVSGPEYMNNVRFGTEWSRRTELLNTHRAIFRVLLSLGTGQGGAALSLRFQVAEGREEEQRRLLAHDILPKLIDDPGIVGCHLARIDGRAMHASANQGVQNKFSDPKHIGPEWLVLIEGGRDPAALERTARARLTDAAFVGAGATGPIEAGLWDLQYGLFRIAA